MKKYILLLLVFPIILSGCSESKVQATTTIDHDVMEVSKIERLVSAEDVNNTNHFEFAISNDLVEGMDTFKIGEKFTIMANDNQTYNLYYSKDKDYNIKDMEPQKFVTYYSGEAQEGFYTLTSENNLDVKISTVA